MKKAACIGVLAGCAAIAAANWSKATALPQASPQIVGRWDGLYRASDPTPMSFLFTKTGKVLVAASTNQGLQGFGLDYKLNTAPQPMHLDFQLPTNEPPVLTIAELSNPQTLRLQMQGTNPGNQRPTRFQDESTLQRISDSAIAPLTQLAQAEQSKEAEGHYVMKTLARSAALHKLETDQFPKTLAELGLSQSATQNYRFELSLKANQLMLKARPRKAGLRSYISVVVVPSTEERLIPQVGVLSQVCQSVRPAAIAPSTPKVQLDTPYPKIECNSGSEPVAF